ncbi:hypothetical protein AYO42_03625 [Rhizomicrobium sp. SCGC AG-212-E05]|nr:hypothetical protein AYO42_03625 [Rhizomicrobium sp. SCGC AG-212-E05]
MGFLAQFQPGLRLAARWLFWPAALVVCWGELTPNPPDISTSQWDKVQHFTAYFGLALLATLAWGRRGWLLRILLSVIALGGLLEILQGFVGRDAAWLDQLANTVGALLGMGWALAWRRLVEGPGRD